jgi:ubiquinone/menaquinone biosynthesis C-methylase UbiE
MEEWYRNQEEYADWAKGLEEGKISSCMENLWAYKEKIYNETIVKYSIKGAKGLEIGSGAGRTCKFLKENKRFVIGIDPITHKNVYNLVTDSLLSAVGENLPFKSNSFYFVITKASLDHAISPQMVFYEVNRVLKNSGYFIVCQNVNIKDDDHPHTFEIKTIKELGNQSNFKLLRIIPIHIRIPFPSWRIRVTIVKSKLYLKINRLWATLLLKYSHHLIFVFEKNQ